ncbi:MAG: acyl carrier protein [Candidatus Binatia bacterium]
MEHFLEPRIRALVAEHLGVAGGELRSEVSLVDDLAADSLDLVDLALQLEHEFDVTIPDRTIERWRTYGDLLDTTLGLTALRAEAEGLAATWAPMVRARVVTANAEGPPRMERAVCLTPYMAEELSEDALAAGRGARLDLALPITASDRELVGIGERFARLKRLGVTVSVHRDEHVSHPHAA